MSDIKIIYIILKLFVLIVFLLFGYILSKKNKNFWLISIPPLLIYAIIEGLRFGRMIDYNIYYFRYINLGKDINSEDYEFIFKNLMHIFSSSGVPYYIFIFLQTLFLIITTFILLKNYKKYLLFILPMVISVIALNENYIRWFLGTSFLFLALNCTFKYDNLKAIFWFICSLLTHIGFIVFLPLLIFKEIINRKPCPVLLGIIIYTFFIYFISTKDLLNITLITNYLVSEGFSGNEKTEMYLNATEGILSGDSLSGYMYEDSFFSKTRMFLTNIPIIIWGQKFISKENWGNYIYNLFLVCIIISPIFKTMEIFDRFAYTLSIFTCLAGGIFYTNSIKYHKLNSIQFWLTIISIILYFYPQIEAIFSRKSDETMLFIWNAYGREYLPF